MLFRTACIVLTLTAWASLSGADSLGDTFRIPDPEEIFEAYQEGFIDFDDYQRLLEVARAEFLTPADSNFLRQFPDLLAGISSQPIIEGVDTETIDEDTGTTHQRPRWRHAALFRQYHRMNDESGNRRIYRLQEEYGEAAFYGEFEEEYSHRRTWYRRGVEYRVRPDSSQNYAVIVGNYQAQFALGLIYGRRGRLLAQADSPTRTESMLYPDYSGGNGILVTAERSEGQYLLVFDIDRNASFEKKYTGMSIPLGAGRFAVSLSGGWGKIANIREGTSLAVSLFSIAGAYESERVDLAAEAATDVNNPKRPGAAAANVSYRRGRVYFRGEVWSYDSAFPTFFTGSLSSRRSRTVYIEDIGFSYSDRYRGECGVAVGSTVRMSSRTTMRTALMYADRGFDDDRIDARLGLKRRLNRNFRVGLDFYWRDDNLYSENETQRRVQFELVESGQAFRNRVVIGRRLYTYGDHNDYLIVVESGAHGSWGAVSMSCKFDRLRPESRTNQYLYVAAKYEVDIGGGIGSYIKYSYRYDRGNPGGSYGIVRWDVRWVIT